MGFFTNRSALQKIAARMIELQTRKQNLDASIDTAEREAGLAILDGDADAELSKVVRLKAERSALDVAIDSLRRQRTEAILAQFREEAAKLRETSRAKAKELADIEAKQEKLIGQISNLLGAKMIANVDPLQPNAQVTFPRTTTLATEIADLDRQADKLETQQVPASGRIDVTVTTDTEVLNAALEYPAEIPAIEVLASWLKGCEVASHRTFGDLSRRVVIAWNDGVIDREASQIFVPAFARKWAAVTGHSVRSSASASEKAAIADATRTERVDVNSGTFRSAA